MLKIGVVGRSAIGGARRLGREDARLSQKRFDRLKGVRDDQTDFVDAELTPRALQLLIASDGSPDFVVNGFRYHRLL